VLKFSTLPGIELRAPNPEAVTLLSDYESPSDDAVDKLEISFNQDNFMQVR
jgi:hypothetical protein